MDQKIENQLNLALALTEEERSQTNDLNTGFDAASDRWELIIRYCGDIEAAARDFGAGIKILSGGYALAYVEESRIEEFSRLMEVIYIEKPKKLYYELDYSVGISCVDSVQRGADGLSGEGVIVAVIDSGIDYAHPDFINEDGTTRIIEIFDEAADRVYGRDIINEALKRTGRQERLALVPVTDASRHGTHVAGIAAGNGRASGGRYRGIAYRSELLIVKLAGDEYFSTARLMEAVDYAVRKAASLGMPVAVNLSFGNNYGSHNGTSLLETYLNDISEMWKNVICVGSGNEAAKGVHAGGVLSGGTVTEELVIGQFEPSIDVQLWKSYSDDFLITLIAPNGRRIGPIYNENGILHYLAGNTRIYVYYGEAAPYTTSQEIFFQLASVKSGSYITPGIWRFELSPMRIRDGEYDMW
ncbi:MAG: S8 family serine peptidase, partial [Butyrivibrio sp.]|nr:S8 family serine peptidase [Butyrivibrio sp.]